MALRRSSVGPATDEFTSVSLGDARLDARVLKLVKAMERAPAAGFPKAVGTASEREATYRLLANARVDLFALLLPHIEQTIGRIRDAGVRPLVLIDKTSFVFSGEADRDGLERLGKNRVGFDCFFALAVARHRAPLGVLAIEPVELPGRVGADVWNLVVTSSSSHVGAMAPVFVMDREADAYALFATLAANERDFVIRVAHDRMVREHTGTAMLRDVAAKAPVLLRRAVKLTRRSGIGKAPQAKRRHPPRDARDAELAVRACTLTLPRPPKQPRDLPASLTLNMVQILEERAPDGVEPVEWLLFTTLPIKDTDAVAAIVDAYRARWTIEEYFKALKTGCSYEKRQLESRHSLLNALGLLAPIAWRLLALRSAGDDPTTPASVVLDDDEIHVLRKISRDIKLGSRPTAHEAITALARLGGHFPQNGRPGWQVIWAGFDKLIGQVTGYRLARAEM